MHKSLSERPMIKWYKVVFSGNVDIISDMYESFVLLTPQNL